MAKKQTPKSTNVVVTLEKWVPPTPLSVFVDTGTKRPERGPAAIVANPHDAAIERKEGQSAAALGRLDQLYLCGACGQQGTIGAEWLRFTGFSGQVNCPSCGQAMEPTQWPAGGR